MMLKELISLVINVGIDFEK